MAALRIASAAAIVSLSLSFAADCGTCRALLDFSKKNEVLFFFYIFIIHESNIFNRKIFIACKKMIIFSLFINFYLNKRIFFLLF